MIKTISKGNKKINTMEIIIFLKMIFRPMFSGVFFMYHNGLAKKRGAFRSTFLSVCDKGSHEEQTLRKPPTAPCFLRCCCVSF